MKTYYDRIAQGYDALHGEEQRRKLSIIKGFIPKGASILDVGCGTGISGMLGNIVGIDPSIGLLRQAKIPTVQGVGEHLPFKDFSFDAVICVTALHNFSDYQKGLAEMERVSKGKVIISLLRKANEYLSIEREIKKTFSVEDIIEDPADMIFVCRKKR
jgi:ubiquinone/menaquinone biosynthesis C-methylase UbiE